MQAGAASSTGGNLAEIERPRASRRIGRLTTGRIGQAAGRALPADRAGASSAASLIDEHLGIVQADGAGGRPIDSAAIATRVGCARINRLAEFQGIGRGEAAQATCGSRIRRRVAVRVDIGG